VRIAALVAAALALATLPWSARAEQAQPSCEVVQVHDIGLLEDCGDELRSFTLNLSDLKREVRGDVSGRFSYACPLEVMCEGEPTITGFFISPDSWQTGAKDEAAIFQALSSIPLGANGKKGASGKMPFPVCPISDVTVAGLPGRAVCFDENMMKGGNVVVVAANNEIAFLLVFYRKDKPSSVVRDKMLALLPRFNVERVTGDVRLLRWIR
jgi:hypothetical protein